MNPRIRELLDKATYDILGVKQVDQTQFAELIVGRCVEIYQAIDNGNARHDTKDYLLALRREFKEK